ncbi:dipeptidase [Alteromonas sp. RKMC-009]|uniref:dipeptidase n=1 Tax=Alteromonas sp. RKMC-009 TaxID=2267264 RepID=UPI000E692724|nr:dipeptidase [Alteromonas sp. RKMC-009]AYA65347.1 membrane dipeptidase [Alteromonas sp. RKMC-009]MEC7690120.1 dipeptidase [Pseudomonadota bacterium]
MGRLTKKPLSLLIPALLLTGSYAANAETIPPVSAEAEAIAQETIIVDGHIDVPYRVHAKWEDVSVATEGGDFDYPRAKKGGLTAPFMSIYVPASLDNSDESTAVAHQLIDLVEAMVYRSPEKFAIAKSVADVTAQFKKGLISLPMGMENGSPVQGSLENLKTFYERGIRYITLAHSLSNHIADSSYDLRRQWHGLSPFGKELVAEMNNLGIMVDISHVSDDAFYQAIEISKVPVIASHSSLRKYTPGFERNMNDDMVKKLGENGGVIMINFGSSFVSKETQDWRNNLTKQKNKLIKEMGEDSAEVAAFDEKYRKENPYPYSTLSQVLDHIDHVVELIGIDHVGIGSDFDGVGDSLPTGLKDVSTYPNLVQGMLDRGYSRKDIEKVLSGNLLRVWSEVEKYAAAH